MKTIPSALALAGLATAGVLAVSAVPASASHGGGGGAVTTTGACSSGSAWKLKVKTDDGQLEVEAEVDSNVVGQMWNWSVVDNGVRVVRGTATTTAPSGSFSVERRIANQPATDTVVFRATNPTTRETCRASIAF
jgi:hypothetical protein